MRICLRGDCKKTGSKHICCLECTETDTCKELGRCTIDTEIDLNKCSKEVNEWFAILRKDEVNEL